MKKYLNDLIIILLLSVFVFVLYFYIPSSVKLINQKVNQSNSLDLNNNERLNLVEEYGSYMVNNLPEDTPKLYFYWYSNQRKLLDLRVKKVIEEIKNTNVKAGESRIWSLLNMGVIIKTSSKIIAIDVANLPFSLAHNELVNLADIFVVSHMDGDHFDSKLIKKALAKNKKAVFIEGFIFDSLWTENVFILTSGKTNNIDGIEITAYQTDHRGDGNFKEPCAWFEIETDGIKILHTGDGRDFKNKDEEKEIYAMRDFDILLGNIQVHSYNVRDIRPKIYIPLHLYKFMSGRDLYEESTILSVLNIHKKHEKDLQGIEIIYLLPGENYAL